MDDPPIAEALLIEAGTVTCVGTRDEVLAAAGDQVPVVDIGENVAYPGSSTPTPTGSGIARSTTSRPPADAWMPPSARGWTSISEQWVNQERIDELEALAADDALPLRVDAYLALNYATDFLGDWYVDREPGPVDDRLRVQGLKIHLDTGSGDAINWEPADLTATIGRANDAGWQVSVHAMSSAAIELLLDAYEAAIGPTGPNPLHHRIEHALQVTDEHLARLVAMDIATVIHLDGAADWLTYDDVLPQVDRDDPDDGDRRAHPLARLRGRRAARRLGYRRAVDVPGLRARRSRRPDRRRRAGPSTRSPPGWTDGCAWIPSRRRGCSISC